MIHLHGRLSNDTLGILATDLVLTSADFGDAYLRSGWAARFLFDLCRCRTIVLVGYTANDPPVRYILNIIEADRARFPELHDVYALAGDDGAGRAAAAWETIAVEPILYPAPEQDPSRLWDELRDMVCSCSRSPSMADRALASSCSLMTRATYFRGKETKQLGF